MSYWFEAPILRFNSGRAPDRFPRSECGHDEWVNTFGAGDGRIKPRIKPERHRKAFRLDRDLPSPGV
jgi:hypothetical protein